MTKDIAKNEITPLVDMQALVEAAIKQGSAVEVLKELETMRKNIVAEKAEREHSLDFSSLQIELPIVPKEKEGDSGKWSYAPIEDILNYREADGVTGDS